MAQTPVTPAGSYTLSGSDDGKIVFLDGSAARTLTGPPATPFLPGTGYFVDVRVIGANAATFAPQGAGATVDGSSTLSIPGDSARRLVHLGGGNWRTSLGA